MTPRSPLLLLPAAALLLAATTALRAEAPKPGSSGSISLSAGSCSVPNGKTEGADKEAANKPAGAATAPAQQEAWLGVVTKSLAKMVGEHLGLPPSSGLAVEMVLPDGPAGKAGLQKDDVLVELDDQRLVLPEQLHLLLKGAKLGSTAKLEILRDGKPMTLDVTLTARPAEYAFKPQASGASSEPANPALPGAHTFRIMPMGPGGAAVPADIQKLQLQLGQIQAEAGIEMEKLPEEIRRQIQAGIMGMAQGQINGQGGVNMQVFRIDQGRVHIDDGNGTIDIEKVDGVQTLTAKDKDGKVQFQGPYGTDEEKAKVPEEVRKRAGKFELGQVGPLDEGIQMMFQGGIQAQGNKIEAEAGPIEKVEGEVKPGDKVD